MVNSNKKDIHAPVPLNIARETIKQMALQRVDPTPDNYQRIYNEIAGIPVKETLDSAIRKVLKQLPRETTEQNNWINKWESLITKESWAALPTLLGDGMSASVAFSKQWPNAIRGLVRGWDAKQTGLDASRKKEALERVLINFGSNPLLAEKIQNLVNSWMQYGAGSTDTKVMALTDVDNAVDRVVANHPLVDSPVSDLSLVDLSNIDANVIHPSLNSPKGLGGIAIETDQLQETFRTLQDMLKQSLNHGLIPRLDGYPELKEEAQQIFTLTENAKKLKDWQLAVKRFRALLVRVELIGANEDGIKRDLLRLLKLLIDNISELVSDDPWLRGQIAAIQTIMSNPMERAMILDAEKSLKEVIFKQGTLKYSLNEAKSSFKNMVATFIDRLGHMSNSTENYQEKIKGYADKLLETDDIAQINTLLESLMQDTHSMQTDIVRSREALSQQQEQVDLSNEIIRKLQEELSQLSEKMLIDQLTGVLNRRGLDEAMLKEIARVNRSDGLLSVVLLDIDNFKSLNDTYGHQVGDNALQHLVKVIKEAIRPTDVVTRFGGEEFVILLPNTGLDEAVVVITRLQRMLTKQFFLSNNERLLITFSAGVALYQKNEDQAAVFRRADQAMYLSKNRGKNRVMTENNLVNIQ